MENWITDHMIVLGVGLILGLFGAFTVGRIIENNNTKEILHLQYEKLKQKTESKLEQLWKHSSDTNGNMQLREGLSFKDIVEHAFIIDENIKEQILRLNQIYLDLITNGTGSTYFVHILDVYGQIGAF